MRGDDNLNRYSISDLLADLLLGLGFILMVSPLFIYWFIHGNYYRLIWILSGPYPFHALVGGTFQYLFYGGLVVAGLSLIAISIISRKSKKTSNYWY